MVQVNGKPARALIDSGSLADFMSTTLADQLKVTKTELAKPLIVQLAVQGSRSTVKYCTDVQFSYAEVSGKRHFDIMNVDGYDLILGTPFIYQHEVLIGLNPPRVVIGSPQPKPLKGDQVTSLSSRLIDVLESKLDKFRDEIKEYASDLCKEAVDTPLPPLRDINHTIPLIDESKIYSYRPAKCPEPLRHLWAPKRDAYIQTGRWKVCSGSNAMPMLFLRKPTKPGEPPRLRTVLDLRERNKNTRKLASPLPDIDTILRRVSSHKYRSLIDGKDAYEQIRIVPEHVNRSIFNTPDGTMISQVMQIGDCNAGATYQAIMNHIFSPYLGVFMDIYLDDLVVYSDTAEDHIKHLKLVIDILRREKFLLSAHKMQLFAHEIKILGHVVDDQGIRMDPSKIETVKAWTVPSDRDQLRAFLGAVGYLAPNVPLIRIPMGILTKITGDTVPFQWSFTEQRAFDEVKHLVDSFRDHHRVTLDYQPEAPPINVVTDGCSTGIGGLVSQGDNWRDAPISAFYSAKLNSAQQNYAVHEVELLAGVETMLRNRHILQGARFRWYTDHKALIHILKQKQLSGRQARWLEKLSEFDFEVIYVPGSTNIVADALSRIYSADPPGTARAESEYPQHDDHDGPPVSLATLISMPVLAGPHACATSVSLLNPADPSWQKRIKRVVLRVSPPGERQEGGSTTTNKSQSVNSNESSEPPVIAKDFEPQVTPQEEIEDKLAPSLTEVIASSASDFEFPTCLKDKYSGDAFFAKVLDDPNHYKNFEVKDGLVFVCEGSRRILCIPQIMIDGRSAREIVISHAHSILAHLGPRKTLNYLREQVWWKDMIEDIHKFCKSCPTCKMSKPNNQRPYGLLSTLSVPEYPWQGIGIDFVGPLPESRNRTGSFDMIAVIIDLLTGMTHLVPSRQTYRAKDIAELVFEHVYCLHGLPKYIVSDRDSLFTSAFWERLNGLIGVQLRMSSAYYPQSDGSTERMNRTVTQMLRQSISPTQKDWVSKLPAIEFAVNSARSETTGFAPFFLNSGRMPRPMIWNSAPKSEYPGVRAFAQKMKDAIMAAHDSVLAARVKQTRQANRLRRPAPFQADDLVYISTQNLRLPKNRARKLIPKFIGPYRITRDFANNSFEVDIPSLLRKRGIHPVFHSALLRMHVPNDDRLFPGRALAQVVDLGEEPPESEWAVDRISAHQGAGTSALFHVKWKSGDSTWLPYSEIEHLEALKSYLDLIGAASVAQLQFSPGDSTAGPLDPQVSAAAIRFVLPLVFNPRFVDANDLIASTAFIRSSNSAMPYAFLPQSGPWQIHDSVYKTNITFAREEINENFAYLASLYRQTVTPETKVPGRYMLFRCLVNSHCENGDPALPPPPDLEAPAVTPASDSTIHAFPLPPGYVAPSAILAPVPVVAASLPPTDDLVDDIKAMRRVARDSLLRQNDAKNRAARQFDQDDGLGPSRHTRSRNRKAAHPYSSDSQPSVPSESKVIPLARTRPSSSSGVTEAFTNLNSFQFSAPGPSNSNGPPDADQDMTGLVPGEPAPASADDSIGLAA